MLNILYVAQTYHPKIGGAERYIDRLAQAMSERGHNVYVLAPTTGQGHIKEGEAKTQPGVTAELERDYTVIRTTFYDNYKKGVLYFLRALPMARKIVGYVQKNDIDVLHFQYINPFAVPIRYLKSSGARVFATIHGSGVHFLQEDWLGKKLLHQVLGAIDGVTPVSDYCGDLAKKWGAPENRIHVVYNGTDPELFIPQNNMNLIEYHTILSACRLVPRKDITTLIKALDRVSKHVKDAKLIVAGDGPDRERLGKLAEKMKLMDHVEFTGFVSDRRLQGLYKSTGIFVLPAKYDESGRDIEGFGISLLEAMSSGRPVIGANVGGIPSAIKSDWGYLYEPEDVNDLSERLRYLMEHKNKAALMGKAGRKAVEDVYNWKYITKRMEEIYESAQ